MGAFLVYMIKSSLCVLAFYLGYKVLLSRETFHRLNRFMLLAFMIGSFALPALHLSLSVSPVVQSPLIVIEDYLNQADVVTNASVVAPQSPAVWITVVLWVYLSGIVFVFLKNTWSIVILCRLIRQSEVVEKTQAYTLLRTEKDGAPFSWMRYIIFSAKDFDEQRDVILEHEKAHVRYGHSWDLLLADVLTILQWFNPAAWLLKQELQQVHEYQADEQVLAHGADVKGYQMLLVKKAVGAPFFALANSFNHRSLKKRIRMMVVEKSHAWASVKYVFVVPVAIVSLAVFAQPEVSDFSRRMSYASMVSSLEFPGGRNAMMAYLSSHVSYPAEALEAGEEGPVTIGYTVDEQGNVTHPQVVNKCSRSLARACLDAISSMPKFEISGQESGLSVRTERTQTFYFTIHGSGYEPVLGDDDIEVCGYLNDGPVVTSYKKENPENQNLMKGSMISVDGEILILLDDREIQQEEMNALDPEKVSGIQIWNSPESIAQKFGDRHQVEGKTTVIEIETKK